MYWQDEQLQQVLIITSLHTLSSSSRVKTLFTGLQTLVFTTRQFELTLLHWVGTRRQTFSCVTEQLGSGVEQIWTGVWVQIRSLTEYGTLIFTSLQTLVLVHVSHDTDILSHFSTFFSRQTAIETSTWQDLIGTRRHISLGSVGGRAPGSGLHTRFGLHSFCVWFVQTSSECTEVGGLAGVEVAGVLEVVRITVEVVLVKVIGIVCVKVYEVVCVEV